MATVTTVCTRTLLMSSGHHRLTRHHEFTRSFRIVSPSDDLESPSLCRLGPPKYFNSAHILKKGVICRSVGSDTISSHEEGKDEEISRGTLIWRAVKLPIYSVALIPLTVGSAAAYLETGSYSAKQYMVLLAASVLIITWLNLSNDVYDFDTGADANKKESVVNVIGSRTGTLLAACVSLALGSIGLIWASARAGNIRSMLLLASAITCGYIYQCPPFRLSYQGLGEPLCFAAFGPFATTAFYLLQSSTSNKIPITGTILSASLLVGITTTLILFCSHFHQIEGDEAVGKMSPLVRKLLTNRLPPCPIPALNCSHGVNIQVRLGTRTGSNVVKMAVVSLYSILFGLGLCKALPATSILFCGITMPIGKLVFDYVEKNHKDKTKIFMAKYYCVRLHALFGAALAAGLIVARIIGKDNVLKPLIG